MNAKHLGGVPAAIAVELYNSYQEDRPTTSAARREWVARKSEQYGVSKPKVELVIAEGENDYLRNVSQSSRNHAQVLADMIGVSTVRALQVLGEQLEATTKRPQTDKDGRYIRDCPHCDGKGKVVPEGGKIASKICEECEGSGGDIVWLEKPDNAARRQAAIQFLKIHEAYAPEKHEVHSIHTHVHLAEDELKERLLEVAGRINRLATGATGARSPVVRVIESGGEGPEGDSG